MKHYTYKTRGTCSVRIDFDIDDNKVYNVSYLGGCNGNLKAISSLVDGLDISLVIKKLEGIKCGVKNTSCADQLAKALKDVKERIS